MTVTITVILLLQMSATGVMRMKKGDVRAGASGSVVPLLLRPEVDP
jgi:hypothetical protein